MTWEAGEVNNRPELFEAERTNVANAALIDKMKLKLI